MKKIIKVSNLIIAAMLIGGIFISVSSCKKKKNDKPTGVIIAEVNGNNWQSATAATIFKDKYDTTVLGTYAELRGDTTLLINGARIQGTDTSSIRIYIRLKTGKTGSYSGTTTAKYGCIYAEGIDFDHIFAATLGYTSTYTLDINSFDIVNRKISGKFTISMVPKSSGTTWNVKNGEFTDVSYKTR